MKQKFPVFLKTSKIGLFLMIIFFLPFVNPLTAGLCANVEITDISPTSINIGEEFTVGILIDNCGTELPKDIRFELKDVSPFIEVKESLNKHIGELGFSNSDRFLIYHMKVSEDASPGKYRFNYRLNYDPIVTEGSFSVTVIGKKAELNIATFKTKPVLPYEGDVVELTLRIENFGKGIANSIKVSVEHPFQGIKDSFIGTLNPDEDGPATFTFIADKSGEFEFPVKISYEDDFGKKEIESNAGIIILKKKINWIGIASSILATILLVWFIIHYFRTKRKKDTIIQQLLEGKTNHHEVKKFKKHKK